MSSAPLRFDAMGMAEPVTQPLRTTATRIEVVDDLARVEPIWRRLERADVLATPYQRFDFLAPWQREVGTRSGVTPLFVVGYDPAGAPAFLWPLGRKRSGPLNVARFLGGKHANYNFALWRRDAAAAMTIDALRAVIDGLAAAGTRIDLLQLFNQPQSWQGVANPFASLPHQASPSFAYRGRLGADFDALLETRASAATRKKMRKKEKALTSHGQTSSWRVTTREDAERVLEAFFAQRAERACELGMTNVYDAPGVHAFIRRAALDGLAEGRPAIELYALEVDGGVMATFGAVPDQRRHSMMFTSITRGPLAQKSPGQILLLNLVRILCERGVPEIDLGVGEAGYKDLFCDEPEPLFDSFIGLTPAGHLAAAASRLAWFIKGQVKRTPMIWDAVTRARRLRGKPVAAD
jgi:CelD/BcsL family acetyltransferase involved in cellulose biosynthesis